MTAILKDQKVLRGTELTNLHTQLSTHLEQLNKSIHSESKISFDDEKRKKFRIFQFKLYAAVNSHLHDSSFSTHRGWSRWLLAPLGNLFFGLITGACTLGIVPPLAYKYGFYFRTKPTSAQIVTDLNNALAIDQNNEKMQFNNLEATLTRTPS